MEYEDFEVQIGPRSGSSLLVHVLRSPAGEGAGALSVSEMAALRTAATGGGLPSSNHAAQVPSAANVEVGGALYRALFSERVGLLFHQSLGRIGNQSLPRGLRIRLRCDPRDPDLASIRSAPWELLYREDTEDFLALSRLTPVVRGFDLPRPAGAPPVAPPFRILIVLSHPRMTAHLELAAELEQLTASLRRNPAIEIEVLDSPDTGTLRTSLSRSPFHVLHFMGHGTFDRASEEGSLFFRGRHGRREAVSGRHLATKIKDFGSLRLVVLNACDTAVAGTTTEHGPFGGVASALVLGGLPAVVAMQTPVRDSHAVAFGAAFYDRLAGGMPVDEAVTEGRQAIHSLSPTSGDWAAPVLFLRTTSGDIFASAGTPVPGPGPTGSPIILSARESAANTVCAPTVRQQVGLPHARGRNAVAAALLLSTAATAGMIVWHPGWFGQPPRDTGAAAARGKVAPSSQAHLPAALALPAAPAAEQPIRSGSSASGGAQAVADGPSRSPRLTTHAINLRFELSGRGWPPSLSPSLSSAFNQVPWRLPAPYLAEPRTVRVEVAPPRFSAYDESGVTLQSCSLSASARLARKGSQVDLGPQQATGSAPTGEGACIIAAHKLADSIVTEIWHHPQED
jgi:hypothetical protein